MAISAALPRPGAHPWPIDTIPDPEVPERPTRRRFTAAYKVAVLDAYEAATEPGAKGALLRREGLYSSHITEWLRLRALAGLEALGRSTGPRPGRSRGRPHASVTRSTPTSWCPCPATRMWHRTWSPPAIGARSPVACGGWAASRPNSPLAAWRGSGRSIWRRARSPLPLARCVRRPCRGGADPSQLRPDTADALEPRRQPPAQPGAPHDRDRPGRPSPPGPDLPRPQADRAEVQPGGDPSAQAPTRPNRLPAATRGGTGSRDGRLTR